MNSLKNLFGFKLSPWRPPLDLLDGKIRPSIRAFDHLYFRTGKFRLYRSMEGVVYAELLCEDHVFTSTILSSKKRVASDHRTSDFPVRRRAVRFTKNWGALEVRVEDLDSLLGEVPTNPPSHGDVQKQALLWWRAKRPVGWNLRLHLTHPTVNCNDVFERDLAHAIAFTEFEAYQERISNEFS